MHRTFPLLAGHIINGADEFDMERMIQSSLIIYILWSSHIHKGCKWRVQVVKIDRISKNLSTFATNLVAMYSVSYLPYPLSVHHVEFAMHLYTPWANSRRFQLYAQYLLFLRVVVRSLDSWGGRPLHVHSWQEQCGLAKWPRFESLHVSPLFGLEGSAKDISVWITVSMLKKEP